MIRSFLTAFIFYSLAAFTNSVLADDTTPAKLDLPDPALLDNREQLEMQALKDNVHQLLDRQDFAKLESLADKTRASGRPWGSGSMAITEFYYAIVELPIETAATYQDRFNALKLWRSTYPHSVTAQIAFARFMVNYAWQARGADWAGKVSDDQWKTFFERLREGADALQDNSTGASFPLERLYAAQKLALGLQMKPEDYRKMMDRGFLLEPTGAELYINGGIYFLPRWYGEPGEIEKLASQYADKVGGEDGDIVYARFTMCAADYCGSTEDIFHEENFSWPRISRGLLAIYRKFPHSVDAATALYRAAKFAGDVRITQQMSVQLAKFPPPE